MRKLLTKIALTVAGFTGVAVAQQDPQFTQFMFNKLIFNPGYAGTSGAICGVGQFRQQWSGFTGSPQSMAVAFDMPIPNLPLGVGLNIINDKIGPMSTFFMRAAGAYNKKIGPGTLGIGLDLGILQKKISDDWITPETGTDPTIPGNVTNAGYTNGDLSKLSFDVGLGAFYQIPGKFYVGVSTTHIPAQDIKEGSLGFKVKRHYYFTAGATFPVTPWFKINPNVLYKTDFAAGALDANLNLLWFDLFWVGGSYRFGDAGALLFGVQKGLGPGNAYMVKAGYSIDLVTGKLASYTKASHEIILGVCYTPKVKKMTSYSNDRFFE